MKITVIKEAATKNQPNTCPYFVDDGGMPTRK